MTKKPELDKDNYFTIKINLTLDKKLIKLILYDRSQKRTTESLEQIPKSVLKYQKNPHLMAAAIKKKIIIVKVKDLSQTGGWKYLPKLKDDDFDSDLL